MHETHVTTSTTTTFILRINILGNVGKDMEGEHWVLLLGF
jgi:hypothetical protein